MYAALMTLILIATAASVTFTLLFGIRSPWYRNRVGKMQFTKSVCLSATLVLTVVNRLATYPGQVIISFAVLTALCVALWIQVVVLLKEQKEARLRWLAKQEKIKKVI